MLPEPQLDELYRDVILDHYRSPRNKGQLSDPTIVSEGVNPLCGDEINLQIHLAGDKVEDIKFHGRGCSISQSSSSMMTELLKGKSLEQATSLAAAFKGMMQGKEPEALEELGDLEALQGVRKYPVRIKCALLAWTTLEEGIKKHLKKKA